MDLLLVYNINSSIFHNILSQHFGGHTSRFIRELYSFATSPYEMDQYDRECVIIRPTNSSHLSFIVTVGRDDSEDVQVGISGADTIRSSTDRVCTDSLGLQVIPSPPMEEPVCPWIDVTRANPSRLPSAPSSLTNLLLANHSAFRRNHGAPASTSTNPSTSVINLSDSENEDCVIIDDAPGPETIVLDDSDEEVENPGTSASNHFFDDSYATAYRPLDLTMSRSTSSQTYDPSPVELVPKSPESSSQNLQESRETPALAENDVKPDDRVYLPKRHRSCSPDSSVLSTCISSDESDHCHRRKRSKRLCRTKSKRVTTHRRYTSDEFLNESTTEDAQSESDWEDSRRKRKKKSKKSHTSKREKKVNSKRKKKPTERKSRKKKPSPNVNDSDRKSRPKKEKTKSKHRARMPVEAVESPRSISSKLCSVVKVVHRDVDSQMDQPCTSSGYKGCDSRNDFTKVNRSFFLSDSD